MKKIFFFICAFVLIESATVQFDWGPQPKVETKTIQSNILDTEREYNIYLPLSYDKGPLLPENRETKWPF